VVVAFGDVGLLKRRVGKMVEEMRDWERSAGFIVEYVMRGEAM
jgi:hypothetical protein